MKPSSRAALGVTAAVLLGLGPLIRPDLGLLTALGRVVDEATAAMEAYNYTRALEVSETFFWSFCDDYLELVKSRRYGDFSPEGAASANSAMLVALYLLRGRQLYWFGAFVLSVYGGMILNRLLKYSFQRARPRFDDPVFAFTGYSFPSGHTITYVGLYGFLAYLAYTLLRPAWLRRLVVAPLVALVQRPDAVEEAQVDVVVVVV